MKRRRSIELTATRYRPLNQLRQELVLTAGRPRCELGYQLLRSTHRTDNAANGRRPGPPFAKRAGANVAIDNCGDRSKVSLSKTIEALDKGEYPLAKHGAGPAAIER